MKSDNWVDRLIMEYEDGRRELHKMKRKLSDSEFGKIDKTQINSMISDMTYVLDWLKTGRDPDNRRGIERRSVYQRQVLADMSLFPSLDIVPEKRELTEEEKKAIYDVLLILSARERQCFIMHNAYMMSMSEISEELGIKKSTVQKYIERAREKIKKKVSCHTAVI